MPTVHILSQSFFAWEWAWDLANDVLCPFSDNNDSNSENLQLPSPGKNR
jgi:hypothetical protein